MTPSSSTQAWPDPILLPCPFCGGTRLGRQEGEKREDGAAGQPARIICADCDAQMLGYSLEDATAAWNRRAVLPTEAPELVGLKAERPFHWRDGVTFSVESRGDGNGGVRDCVVIAQYKGPGVPVDRKLTGELVIPLAEWKSAVKSVSPAFVRPATVSSAVPVAWIVERDGKTYLPFIRSREEMERYVKNNPDERLLALYTSPQDRDALEPLQNPQQLDRAAIIGGQSLDHIGELASRLERMMVGSTVVVTSEFQEIAQVLRALIGDTK